MGAGRMLRDWGSVAAKAVGYGTLSCALGPVTPGNRVSRWAMHRWALGACRGLELQRELVDGQNLERAPQAILVANHLSLLDTILIGSFLKRDYRWVAKAELFKIPFLGWHMALNGHIPVDRRRREGNRSLPVLIHAAVEEGASILFYPEGTRSKDGKLQPFKIGAFRTAVAEELPVLPLVVRGTGQLMKKGALGVAPPEERKASVTVLPPVPAPTEGDDAARAEALRDLVWQRFAEELGQ